MVMVPTFDKLQFCPVPYVDDKKAQFSEEILKKILHFYILSFFMKEKIVKFNQIYCEMSMKKC